MNQSHENSVGMTTVSIGIDNKLSELLIQAAESGERVIIEQQGEAIAALITYAELKRLEAIEAILLEKVELEEHKWLKAAVRSPAFDSLRAPEEDIYTLADGKPFHDPEWINIAASDLTFGSTDSEDIYALDDGKPFHDKG